MQSVQLNEIFADFRKLTDPRLERGREHRLFDIVVIAVCAAVAGAESWVDVERYGREKRKFLERFLGLPGGIPSHDTFGRVFSLLDSEEFFRVVAGWLARLQELTAGRLVAIDGKTLRGSFDTARKQSPLALVSAWAVENRLVLGQTAVDPESNEITAIPRLLDLIDVKGATVTIDAMGCQKEIAKRLIDQGADYVLGVKDNQPTLYREIVESFGEVLDQKKLDSLTRRHVTTERAGETTIIRQYFVRPAPAKAKAWAGAKSIGMVVTVRQTPGKPEQGKTRYYISSLPPKVRAFARAVRGHWTIENQLHWSLDVTFAEDASRIRNGAGPQHAAVLRRMALSLLQQDTSIKDNLTGKRRRAGWNDDTMMSLILGISRRF